MSGPEFLVHNDAKPLIEARVNAVEDARTKAETYAKALNVRLGRVLMVTEVLIAAHAPCRCWREARRSPMRRRRSSLGRPRSQPE